MALACLVGVWFQDRRDGDACHQCGRMHSDLPIFPRLRLFRWLP
jgi:hypothetical protein